MKKRNAFFLIIVLLLMTTVTALAFGFWSDDFESYALNSNLHGQGGWKGWDNTPAAGGVVSNAFALSGTQSQMIAGGADSVHEYSGVTTGFWTYTAWQYIPGNFTGQSYFILLNTYNDFGPYNWSLQLCFDGSTNMVSDDPSAGCGSGASMPIVYDQWVEIRVEIDLDTNMMTVFYDGTELLTDSWTEHASGGGALDVAAVDLFANNATDIYYDDMSLLPPQPTDVSLTDFGGEAVAGNGTILLILLPLLLVAVVVFVQVRKPRTEA